MQDGEQHTGRCNCGAVRFRCRGQLRDVIYCHCVQCRRQSGHFFAATSVAAERLAIEGEASLTWYAASDQALRGFCATCGAVLFWKRDGADTVSILAGALDAPTGLGVRGHMYAEEKGDYYEITDGAPILDLR